MWKSSNLLLFPHADPTQASKASVSEEKMIRTHIHTGAILLPVEIRMNPRLRSARPSIMEANYCNLLKSTLLEGCSAGFTQALWFSILSFVWVAAEGNEPQIQLCFCFFCSVHPLIVQLLLNCSDALKEADINTKIYWNGEQISGKTSTEIKTPTFWGFFLNIYFIF